MAFNLVAQLQLQVVGLQQAVASINRGLQDVRATVQVNPNQDGARRIDELNNRLKTLQGGLTSAAAASGSLASTSSAAGASSATAAAGLTGFGAAAARAAAQARTAAVATRQASDSLSQFGALAGLSARRFLAFTVAAGGIASFARSVRQGFSDALQFEREMTKIYQISTETSAEVGKVGDEITRVATAYGVSSVELAKAAEQLKETGVSVKEVVAGIEPLALARLAPSFGGDLGQVVQGSVAAIRQFGAEAGNLTQVLGSMNAVAAGFAVESKDIVDAVQRAGGAFKSAGGNLDEFLALFTSVRATTRESADAIATGLRTIFTRIQSEDTVRALKDLNIHLRYTSQEAHQLGDRSLENQFVGAYEAVRRLSVGLAGLRTSDPRYSQAIEALGGYRQVSRVIPLVQQFDVAQRALAVSQSGSVSLSIAAEKAQQSLGNQLDRTKESYQELFRTLFQSEGFRTLAKDALSFARSLAEVASILRPLIPLALTLATIRLARGAGGLFGNAAAFFTGSGLKNPVGRATGGVVPGVGDTDSVNANLVPGEFVLNKRASRSIGYEKLSAMNRGERVRMAGGGPTPLLPGSGGILRALEEQGYPDEHRFLTRGSKGLLARRIDQRKQNLAYALQADGGFGEVVLYPGYRATQQLTKRERVAVSNYTASSDAINSALRGGSKHGVERQIALVRSAVSKGRLPGGQRLYRGIEDEAYQFYRDKYGVDLFNERHEGREFVEPGFASASLSHVSASQYYGKSYHGGALLTLVPTDGIEGWSAEKLSHQPGQREVILQAGSRFRLLKAGSEPTLQVFAGGGLARLQPGAHATKEELLSSLAARFADEPNYAHGQDYTSALARASLTDDVLSRIPSGSSFQGSGLTAVAFRTPDGKVIRLQPQAARKLASRRANRYGRVLSPDLLSTTRPSLLGVLQAEARERVGSGRRAVLAELTPFASDAPFENQSDEHRGVVARLNRLLNRQGHYFKDSHAGNIGVVDGRYVVRDPGAVARLQGVAALGTDAYEQKKEEGTHRLRRAGGGLASYLASENYPEDFERGPVSGYRIDPLGGNTGYLIQNGRRRGRRVFWPGYQVSSQLTGPELETVGAYTRGSDEAINTFLRGSSAGDADVEEKVKLLRSATLKGRLPAGQTLYRGISEEGLSSLYRHSGAYLTSPDYVGREFVEPGFSSTSLEPATAKYFAARGGNFGAVLRILLGEGQRGLSVNNFSRAQSLEKEVILPPGQRFRLLQAGSSPLVEALVGHEERKVSGGLVQQFAGGGRVSPYGKIVTEKNVRKIIKEFSSQSGIDFTKLVKNVRVGRYVDEDDEGARLTRRRNDTYGIYHGGSGKDRRGTVLLSAGNISSLDELRQTLAHELGHAADQYLGGGKFASGADYRSEASRYGRAQAAADYVGDVGLYDRLFSRQGREFRKYYFDPVEGFARGFARALTGESGDLSGSDGPLNSFALRGFKRKIFGELAARTNKKKEGPELGFFERLATGKGFLGSAARFFGFNTGGPVKPSFQEYAASNVSNVQKLFDQIGLPLPADRVLGGLALTDRTPFGAVDHSGIHDVGIVGIPKSLLTAREAAEQAIVAAGRNVSFAAHHDPKLKPFLPGVRSLIESRYGYGLEEHEEFGGQLLELLAHKFPGALGKRRLPPGQAEELDRAANDVLPLLDLLSEQEPHKRGPNRFIEEEIGRLTEWGDNLYSFSKGQKGYGLSKFAGGGAVSFREYSRANLETVDRILGSAGAPAILGSILSGITINDRYENPLEERKDYKQSRLLHIDTTFNPLTRSFDEALERVNEVQDPNVRALLGELDDRKGMFGHKISEYPEHSRPRLRSRTLTAGFSKLFPETKRLGFREYDPQSLLAIEEVEPHRDVIGAVFDALGEAPRQRGKLTKDLVGSYHEFSSQGHNLLSLVHEEGALYLSPANLKRLRPADADQPNVKAPSASEIHKENLRRGRRFERGGTVGGDGDGDKVPALLTPGEFVFNRDAVARIGLGRLHQMNAHARPFNRGGYVQQFADGGEVETLAFGNRGIQQSPDLLAAIEKAAQQMGLALEKTTRVLVDFSNQAAPAFKGFVDGAKKAATKPSEVGDVIDLDAQAPSIFDQPQKATRPLSAVERLRQGQQKKGLQTRVEAPREKTVDEILAEAREQGSVAPSHRLAERNLAAQEPQQTPPEPSIRALPSPASSRLLAEQAAREQKKAPAGPRFVTTGLEQDEAEKAVRAAIDETPQAKAYSARYELDNIAAGNAAAASKTVGEYKLSDEGRRRFDANKRLIEGPLGGFSDEVESQRKYYKSRVKGTPVAPHFEELFSGALDQAGATFDPAKRSSVEEVNKKRAAAGHDPISKEEYESSIPTSFKYHLGGAVQDHITDFYRRMAGNKPGASIDEIVDDPELASSRGAGAALAAAAIRQHRDREQEVVAPVSHVRGLTEQDVAEQAVQQEDVRQSAVDEVPIREQRLAAAAKKRTEIREDIIRKGGKGTDAEVSRAYLEQEYPNVKPGRNQDARRKQIELLDLHRADGLDVEETARRTTAILEGPEAAQAAVGAPRGPRVSRAEQRRLDELQARKTAAESALKEGGVQVRGDLGLRARERFAAAGLATPASVRALLPEQLSVEAGQTTRDLLAARGGQLDARLGKLLGSTSQAHLQKGGTLSAASPFAGEADPSKAFAQSYAQYAGGAAGKAELPPNVIAYFDNLLKLVEKNKSALLSLAQGTTPSAALEEVKPTTPSVAKQKAVEAAKREAAAAGGGGGSRKPPEAPPGGSPSEDPEERRYQEQELRRYARERRVRRSRGPGGYEVDAVVPGRAGREEDAKLRALRSSFVQPQDETLALAETREQRLAALKAAKDEQQRKASTPEAQYQKQALDEAAEELRVRQRRGVRTPEEALEKAAKYAALQRQARAELGGRAGPVGPLQNREEAGREVDAAVASGFGGTSEELRQEQDRARAGRLAREKQGELAALKASKAEQAARRRKEFEQRDRRAARDAAAAPGSLTFTQEDHKAALFGQLEKAKSVDDVESILRDAQGRVAQGSVSPVVYAQLLKRAQSGAAKQVGPAGFAANLQDTTGGGAGQALARAGEAITTRREQEEERKTSLAAAATAAAKADFPADPEERALRIKEQVLEQIRSGKGSRELIDQHRDQLSPAQAAQLEIHLKRSRFQSGSAASSPTYQAAGKDLSALLAQQGSGAAGPSASVEDLARQAVAAGGGQPILDDAGDLLSPEVRAELEKQIKARKPAAPADQDVIDLDAEDQTVDSSVLRKQLRQEVAKEKAKAVASPADEAARAGQIKEAAKRKIAAGGGAEVLAEVGDALPDEDRQELRELARARAAAGGLSKQSQDLVDELRRKKSDREFAGRHVGFEELAAQRAAPRIKQDLEGRGPVVSETTKAEVQDANLNRERARLARELNSAQQRLLQALYPGITAEERRRLANEAVGRALNDEEKVIRDASGRVLGAAGAVAEARARGVDAAGVPQVAPPGAGGLGYRIRSGFFGAVSGVHGAVTGGLQRANASRFGQALANFQGASTPLLLAAPYVAEGVSRVGGTAEDAAVTGREGRYQAAQGASGAIQGALLGATIGGSFGGPVGGAVGAVVGGAVGLGKALSQAADDIRSAKIGVALGSLADKLNSVGNGVVDPNNFSTVGPEVASVARENLSEYLEKTGEQSAKEATSYFAGFDAEQYAALQTKSLRRDLGGQLPQFQQILSRDAERSVRLRRDDSVDAVVDAVKAGNGGLNQQLLELTARVRQLPLAAVEEEFKRTVLSLKRAVTFEENVLKGAEGSQQAVNAFSRLALSIQAASDSILRLQSQTQVLTDAFDGAVNAQRVSFGSEAVTQLGRNDRGALAPLETLAKVGGDDAKRLLGVGRQADRAAAELPTVLAEIASRDNRGQTADQDFATAVANRLRERLGEGDDTEAIIASVVRGLNESSGDKGIRGVVEQLQVDASGFAQKLLAAFIEPLRESGQKAAKALEDNAGAYVSALVRVRAQGAAAGESADRLAQLRAASLRGRAEIAAGQGGRRSQALDLIPLAELQRPLQQSLERLTGERGAAAADPELIGRRLSEANEQAKRAAERQDRVGRDTGGRGQQFAAAAEELVRLKGRAADLQQALKSLTDVAARTAAAQEKLAKISEDRSSRLSFGQSYLTSDLERRSQAARGLVLANAAANSKEGLGGFLPDEARLIVETLRSLGNARLTGFEGSPVASDVLENIVKKTAGGVFDVDEQRRGEEKNLQGQIVEAYKASEEAQKQLLENQRRLTSDLLTGLRQQQTEFFSNLEKFFARDRLKELETREGSLSVRARRLDGLRQDRDVLTAVGIRTTDQVKAARDNKDLREFSGAISRKQVQDKETEQNLKKLEEQYSTKGVFGGEKNVFNPYDLHLLKIKNVRGDATKAVQDFAQSIGLSEKDAGQVGKRFKSVVGEETNVRRLHDLKLSTNQLGDEQVQEDVKRAVFRSIREVLREKGSGFDDKIGKLRGKLSDEGFDVGALEKQFATEEGSKKFFAALQSFDAFKNRIENLGGEVEAVSREMKTLAERIRELRGDAGRNQPAQQGGGQPPLGPLSPLMERIRRAFDDRQQQQPQPFQFARGGVVPDVRRFASGGQTGTDVVPAMLTPGEFVVNAQAARNHLPFLENLNRSGKPLQLARGGPAYLQWGGFPLFGRRQPNQQGQEEQDAYFDVIAKWSSASLQEKEQLRADFQKRAGDFYEEATLREYLRLNYDKLKPEARGVYKAWSEILQDSNKQENQGAVQLAQTVRKQLEGQDGRGDRTPEEDEAEFRRQLELHRKDQHDDRFLEALEGRLPGGANEKELLEEIERVRKASAKQSPAQRAFVRAMREKQARHIQSRASGAVGVGQTGVDKIPYDAVTTFAGKYKFDESKLTPVSYAILLENERYKAGDRFIELAGKPLEEQKQFWEKNADWIVPGSQKLARGLPLERRAEVELMPAEHQKYLQRVRAAQKEKEDGERRAKILQPLKQALNTTLEEADQVGDRVRKREEEEERRRERDLPRQNRWAVIHAGRAGAAAARDEANRQGREQARQNEEEQQRKLLENEDPGDARVRNEALARIAREDAAKRLKREQEKEAEKGAEREALDRQRRPRVPFQRVPLNLPDRERERLGRKLQENREDDFRRRTGRGEVELGVFDLQLREARFRADNARKKALARAEKNRLDDSGLEAALNPFGASGLLKQREELQKRGEKIRDPRRREAYLKNVENVLAARRQSNQLRGLAQRQAFAQTAQGALANFGLGRPGHQSQVFERAYQRRQEFDDLAAGRDPNQARALAQRQQGQRVPVPFARGGSVPYLMGGGLPEPRGSDTVFAMLEPGEYVVRKDSAQANLDLLRRLNSGEKVGEEVRGYATGGLIGGGRGSSTPVSPGAGLSPEVAQAFSRASESMSDFSSSFGDGVGKLVRSLEGWSRSADKLAEALSAFPSTLTVTGRQEVTVVINGGEILSRIMPEIRAVVEEGVKTRIAEVFKRYLPDANVSLD